METTTINSADIERLIGAAAQRWLTRQQAAEYMGVSRETIRRLVSTGKLVVHHPTPRTARYDRLQIDTYVRSQASNKRQVSRRRKAAAPQK